jgi:hypothetical protein
MVSIFLRNYSLAVERNNRYIQNRGNEMGVRIKPVEPTVITDKKIIRQVIAEIHRKPTKKDLARLQEGREVLKRAMASEQTDHR